ncbi:MAG: hypothetical protein PHC97_02150 [Patescibacteria group bacterium]|nr:hypothetical protein [Patescibacteria group bacterium]
MEPKLISISDLIKKGWELYTGNIKKMFLPILYLLPIYVILYILGYLNFSGQLIVILLVTTLSIFANLWVGILFIEMIDGILKNKPTDLGALAQSSLRKIASYFWVGILVGLITMAGFILLIIPGIIFVVWYSFAEYIVVLEDDKKGTKALTESKELVRGRWGASFWRLLIPGLIVYVIGGAISLVITLAASSGNIDFATIDQNIIFNSILTLIFLALMPLFTAYGIILYNNLKETKRTIIQ